MSYNGEECNICFDKVDMDNLLICGNKKCSFRMCSQCTISYKKLDNKNCPQCRLPITTTQFSDITSETEQAITPNTSGRECCIRIKCSNRFGEYVSQSNKNIFKCVTGAVFVICVPKILGYYLINGGVVGNIFDAWRSCEGIKDICQPLLGSAILGMCGGAGYTCWETIKTRSR